MATPIFNAAHFQNEEAALAWIEVRVWPNGAVCPFCSATGERVRKLGGKTTRPGLWKCYACRKPFTAKIKTVMEASHIPAHVWLQAMHLISTSKKGISSNQLHRTLGVTLKSAWFLSHRLREAMNGPAWPFGGTMGGNGSVVEADETIGGKAENRAFGPIPPKQQLCPWCNAAAEFVAFRSSRYCNQSGPDHRSACPRGQPFHDRRVERLAHSGTSFISHQTVNHSAKEYVRDEVYTNTVEGYFSILKRGIYGVYQHVSEAHLKHYLAEFDFPYSNRAKLGVDDVARTDLAIKGIVGKRLTYRTTRGGRPAATASETRT